MIHLNADTMRKDARSIFQDALKAVDPETAVRKYLFPHKNAIIANGISYDLSKFRHIYVVGAGKASAAMAMSLEDCFSERISLGIVTVKYGHTAPLKKIGIVEAGHPVPDENGQRAAEEILSIATRAGKDDLIICLISGGASSLLPCPAPGLSLQQKQSVTRTLLGCGATIHEINTIRKHLSRIKGGRLAQTAYPARIISFILSDVVGDDPGVIASGPTVPDESSYDDCWAIINKYGLENELTDSVLSHLKAGVSGIQPETPKPDEPFQRIVQNVIVASNRDAILAAEHAARRMGYHPLVLSSMIEGETRDVSRFHTAIAKEALKTGHPVKPPGCILSGGETTVTLRGSGKGGRNQEFVLAAAMDIDGLENLLFFSAGTDGTDGPTDAAGAVADGKTVSRAIQAGLDPLVYLNNNDAYHFFSKLNDLVITGPTNTNVMDLRIILIA